MPIARLTVMKVVTAGGVVATKPNADSNAKSPTQFFSDKISIYFCDVNAHSSTKPRHCKGFRCYNDVTPDPFTPLGYLPNDTKINSWYQNPLNTPLAPGLLSFSASLGFWTSLLEIITMVLAGGMHACSFSDELL
jgi:hypothetical protein